jgi:hypothetical protein
MNSNRLYLKFLFRSGSVRGSRTLPLPKPELITPTCFTPEISAEFVLLSIKILFSCEDLLEKGFASLTNRPRARRRPRARTARLSLAHSRASGIGKDQSARPVSCAWPQYAPTFLRLPTGVS